MVGKNDLASKKTLCTLGCDLSPSSLLKETWHVKINNKTSFLYTSMHKKYLYRQGQLDAQKKIGPFLQ
jgi:hypothetical protein